MTTEILSGALVLTLGAGAFLKIDNVNLEKDLIIANNSISRLEKSNNNLKQSLSKQNIAIESIKVDYNIKLAEYESKKPEIIEVIKYKYKDINITRGNCDDVKDFANALSGAIL